MPPQISARGPRHFIPRTLQHEDVFDEGTLFDGRIDDHLRRDSLTAAPALVGGDDDARLAVLNTVAERLGGEAGKDDGMDGADASAGEEGSRGLPRHGEIDRDRVSLFDAEPFERVRDGAYFAEQFGVGDVFVLAGLVCLINDGRLAFKVVF